MWSARTSAPTCLEAPVVCAHTLKHTYACFSHGRTCQPADVWHHALSEEEVFPPPVLQCVCVCVCVCARVGGRRLLSWLMDWTAVSYWAERTGMVTQRNAAEEGFAGRMTWGENSRKARKWISTNQQQQRQQTHTHTHTHREKRCQKTRRPEVLRVYTFHSVSQCLLQSFLSLTQLAMPQWLTALWSAANLTLLEEEVGRIADLTANPA